MTKPGPVMPRIERFTRAEFLAERWAYAPGEHVTMLAPTTGGKTTFMFELLDQCATEKHPAVVLVVKPKDKVVRAAGKRLGFRQVPVYPPVPSPWRPATRGYVLWPRHTGDIDKDEQLQYHQMKGALRHAYAKGNRIVVADETYMLCRELHLERELIALWSRGASLDAGVWALTQKPSYIPTWAYNSAHHLFLGKDPDKRNRDRFGEIGGVDPRMVGDAVLGLGDFEWLYIRRNGPALCIVGA